MLEVRAAEAQINQKYKTRRGIEVLVVKKDEGTGRVIVRSLATGNLLPLPPDFVLLSEEVEEAESKEVVEEVETRQVEEAGAIEEQAEEVGSVKTEGETETVEEREEAKVEEAEAEQTVETGAEEVKEEAEAEPSEARVSEEEEVKKAVEKRVEELEKKSRRKTDPSRSLRSDDPAFLKLLLEGKSNKEIAQILGKDPSTVSVRKQNLKRKLKRLGITLEEFAKQKGIA